MYSRPALPWNASTPLKTRSGRISSRQLDQVLQVVAHADQDHLVAPDPERVGDLVLHLGLIVFPRRDLGRHLALVVGVVPPVVGGVEVTTTRIGEWSG